MPGASWRPIPEGSEAGRAPRCWTRALAHAPPDATRRRPPAASGAYGVLAAGSTLWKTTHPRMATNSISTLQQRRKTRLGRLPKHLHAPETAPPRIVAAEPELREGPTFRELAGMPLGPGKDARTGPGAPNIAVVLGLAACARDMRPLAKTPGTGGQNSPR
jgi:hypothetical protein